MELSKYIGSKIKELRIRNNYTQDYLAELLSTTRQSISRYENGDRKANQDLLFELADIFNVSINDFFPYNSETKANITDIYNQLNPDRQVKVYSYAQHELGEQNKIIDINEVREEQEIYLQSKVSAGTGILDLDPTFGETVSFDGEIPSHYDLAFLVSGNSMEPIFEDGEIIFVEKYPNPINGALMVVQIDEQAYIKKVYLEKDSLRLVSLNQDYDDILADGNNSIRIVGKVVF
ncbi:XRE family transcriptional regulator [Tetragenococcus koreensis]|uniref:XRE family transcriptional regulator n=1 Tax=Tetragenococcus koreensis TaxID=290335 RepID=UPI001F28045E|nr:XRE family transcriptional regulator [Tetragenococcus koreensis]MCF1585195.1 XRE family transcriptional regulator [Tetragenococcus koreensis]MCF1628829.1 XRE family transcriptional regulator [Tetragenococcus koreensis]MCF1633085.1 XRE family transcriptional regulator [Tetragenococcus koreensis]